MLYIYIYLYMLCYVTAYIYIYIFVYAMLCNSFSLKHFSMATEFLNLLWPEACKVMQVNGSKMERRLVATSYVQR